MGLSTDNLPEGGGINKVVGPGNVTAKINSITLEPFKFIPDAYHLVMDIETEPIEGFEGFMIDKEQPKLGNHKGQVGKVKASQYAFADGTTKTGIKIERDRSILIFLKNLCSALGKDEWFKTQNNKHNTIEDFIMAANNDRPFDGVFLDFCLAGKEYENKSGYISHNLWLPKSEKGSYAFTPKATGKVMIYNETKHLAKLDIKPVTKFEDDDDSIGQDFSQAGSDFDLD